MASGRRGYIYIGVTSNLSQRVHQHREKLIDGFSKWRNTVRLVRYEFSGTMEHAIAREKQLKNWRRDWKIELVESDNPDWIGLAPGVGIGSVPLIWGKLSGALQRDAVILKQVQDDE